MQQYDACYDMARWNCLGLMQAKTDGDELIWIKDSNVSSFNIALLVHYLIFLKQQGYLVLSCIKPLQMDRLNFSDHFSYINLCFGAMVDFLWFLEVLTILWNFPNKVKSRKCITASALCHADLSRSKVPAQVKPDWWAPSVSLSAN